MKVLDLFSGIGGFSLGLERAGMETIAFCEFDKHAQKILKKHWPEITIHEDIKKLDARQYRGSVDIVCGGFPCQDLSCAGKQAGFDGDRSSLYRQMLRIIGECLPRYTIFENVSGLLTGDQGRWFARFLYDLAEIGLDAEWHCIPASALGANHHRDRVWIITYPKRSDAQKLGLFSTSLHKEIEKASNGFMHVFNNSLWREDQRKICGADDGVSRRMDRHRLARLGNAVVPQIPELIGRAIIEYEKSLTNK